MTKAAYIFIGCAALVIFPGNVPAQDNGAIATADTEAVVRQANTVVDVYKRQAGPVPDILRARHRGLVCGARRRVEDGGRRPDVSRNQLVANHCGLFANCRAAGGRQVPAECGCGRHRQIARRAVPT